MHQALCRLILQSASYIDQLYEARQVPLWEERNEVAFRLVTTLF